jgi:hypothetical protein
MNIIKKIKIKDNERNLIIYKNNKNKDIANLDGWLYSSLPIYSIYYGKSYNPPFFNNIISLKKNTLEDIQKIWNMTIYGGYIILNISHKSYFNNSIIYKNDKYILLQKNSFITYKFSKYRIIDFIIAGTMKGGTTAAITNFNKHPQISIVKKEIHYFDKKQDYQRGEDWYKSHFDYSKKMVGDKAPDVMYMYSCLELLQMTNPQVKILLFLRNPIDRAYSHWKMTRDYFGNKDSFEYCVNDELQNRMGENRLYNVAFRNHFIQRGFYYEQLIEILKYFPKDNIYIVISEKVRMNMDYYYQKIFNFLDVDEFHTEFVENFVSKKNNTLNKECDNDNDNLNKRCKLHKFLKKLYSDDVKKLEDYLGYKTDWW